MFAENFVDNNIYKPSEIREMLHCAFVDVQTCKKHGFKGVEYYNAPAAFDTEVTSFEDSQGEKCATMYEWTLGFNGLVMVGRTWADLLEVLEVVSETLGLSVKKRLLIYVHNLGYEFQFMRKRIPWAKVFAVDFRKPVYALTVSGIEFRDSLILSGYSLETVGKHLHTYKARKMIGDLDYSLMRNAGTPLTDEEIGYCVNDVQVLQAYIQETIESDGSIAEIPMTKTGYVRRYVRDTCFGYRSDSKNYKRFDYLYLMQHLTIEPDEYVMLKQAFQGGFTHASPFYSGDLQRGITSMDLTSSYPTQLVAQSGYPISKGQHFKVRSKDDFYDSINNYACLFVVRIQGLESIFTYDSYISASRCRNLINPVLNNGRIVSADYLETTITEQDYFIIARVYDWESLSVGHMIRYRRGYLPHDFVKSVLELYKSKTELKGLQGYDENGVPYSVTYMSMKAKLNACFGMCCTDIVRDDITYEDDWSIEKPDLVDALQDYNKSKNRFLFYPWGVWNTAFARVAVWSAIFALGSDYVYCDTDSVKFLHSENHTDYFERYNAYITRKLENALDYHGLDYGYIAPENVRGEKKPLGIWDFDGQYDLFKTLGAKRYLVKYGADLRNGKSAGGYGLTVSGLNKQITLPYLLETYGEDGIWAAFAHGLYIPAAYTGKNTHTYIDDARDGILVDYLGNAAPYHEESSIHLGPADYSLSIAESYADYLLNIKEIDL